MYIDVGLVVGTNFVDSNQNGYLAVHRPTTNNQQQSVGYSNAPSGMVLIFKKCHYNTSVPFNNVDRFSLRRIGMFMCPGAL